MIRVGGVWQSLSGVQIFAGGVWRKVIAIKVYASGAWQTVANFTPPPPPSLTVSANPTSQFVSGSTSSLTSSAVAISASGGTAPYAYSHTVLSSGGALVTIQSPTSASTAVSARNLTSGDGAAVTLQCQVTDSLGVKGAASYSITFERE